MKLVRMAFAVSALLLLAFLASSASAQNARVSGTVTDASDAAVTQTNVTAANIETGIKRDSQTNSLGFYSIDSLAPGFYAFTFEKSGFKTVRFDKIQLTVDQVLSLDAKLEVGSVSTTVEVSSEAATPIDTDTPALSYVVEHQQMTELPLILRDPYQLVLLGPGVTQSDGLGGVSVNGGRERNNNFLLDGADNNDTEVPGGLGGITSQNPDSTQEFRVITNNFAPEYGRNNGAVIDVITKSGTNDFHGNLFYFGRWDALGARDYFNHNIDPVTGDVEAKNPYVRNLYGGSVGGPIKKDRIFFFLNYQADRFVTTRVTSSTVPTDAFKTGIFTYTNPQTGVSQALNVTTPGAGNNATGVGLDPVAQSIFALYPSPTLSNGDGITGTFFFPTTSREKDEDPTIKVDAKINKNNNLFARYTYNWFSDPDPFHSDILPGGLGAIPERARTQGLAVGLTSVFGSTFTNEARFGANRTNLSFGCNGTNVFDSFGFVDPEGRGADFSFPGFTGFGCQGLGDANGQARRTGTYQVLDNMTKIIGRHTMKWGAEFRDVYSNNFTDFFSRANFLFNTFSDSGVAPLTGLNPGVNSSALENEVAGLLGLVDTQSQTQFFNKAGDRLANDELNFRQREVGVFWQDEWKIKTNLSITYGLRWEYYGVPFEASGNLSNLFEDASGAPPDTNCQFAANCFLFSPVGPGSNLNLFHSYYANVLPRVGFAWDPFKTGKTSIRGGIGAFSDRVYGNLISDARGNPPFQPSFATFPTFFQGPGPTAQLQNQAPPPALSASPEVDNLALIFPDLFAHNIKPPLLVGYNVGIQRELTRNLTVEANYVGNHGTRILRVIDGNPPQPALVSQLLADGVDPATLQFNALYFGAEVGAIPFDAVNNNAFLHTFTDATSGHSWYNGLQLQATLRNYHGLLIQGAYTYSHALDDSSDPLVPTTNNGNFPIDSFDLRREKGNSGFDTRHRGVINFVYQIPVGRGYQHLSQGAVGRIFEGLEFSGIAAFQTGLPYDIFGFVDTLHTGLSDRATLVDPTQLKVAPALGAVIPSLAVFTGFNPAAFNDDLAAPPFGVPSNIGRNHWYGPGVNNWDMVLGKTAKITEKTSFRLRFEFYNIFNRTQFAKPLFNNIGDALEGYSTAQVGQNDGTTGARQVQIGAKFIF